MSKVLVRTNLLHRFNRPVNFGFGIITFNEEGVGEVDSEHIDQLEEHNLEIEESLNKIQKSDLDKLKKDELIKLAIEAECPEAEFISLNKEDLIKYLLEKLS